MPFVAQFETAGELTEFGHVVDGQWYIEPGEGVRVDSSGTGYDRLVAIGDRTWETNYEVLAPFTIHASSLGGPAGVGLVLGWQGHVGIQQPRLDAPFQAISWVKNYPDSTRFYLENPDTSQIPVKVGMTPSITANVRYMMRTRSQSLGDGFSAVKTKIWEDGTPEPAGWDLEADMPTFNGSVLILAHRSLATFGDVSIAPLPSLEPRTFTVNMTGGGSVLKAPDQPSYVYGDTVIVTAIPDTGWTFHGWTAGLSGSENPDTIVIESDTTVTAVFHSSPVARWLLDEVLGLVASDTAGANDGMLVGGATWRPLGGRLDGALEFDGVDDRVDVGPLDVSGSGLSLVFWFRADDVGRPEARLVAKASGETLDEHYWSVSIVDSTALEFRLKTDGVTTAMASSAGEVVAGEWYHVAATYDGATMRIYKNASEIAASAKTGAVSANPSAPVALGDAPAGAGNVAFDGLLDDVRVHDRGIDAGQVALESAPGTNSPPFAVFSAVPSTGEVPLLVDFDASGSWDPEDDPLAYTWDFGDSTPVESGGTVQHTYASADTYYVTLTVSDDRGKLDTALDTIVVDTAVTFTLTIGVSGNGAVERHPLKPAYLPGDTVFVTAIPDTGWTFGGWTAGLSGLENPDTVVISSDTTLTASFRNVLTGVESPLPVTSFVLEQNWPNPFSGRTTFQYGLPKASDVEIEVFDVAGRRVYGIRVRGSSPGWNRFLFDGRDDRGSALASGVYFLRVRAGEAVGARKIVIAR
jgi:PKD repeat protein